MNSKRIGKCIRYSYSQNASDDYALRMRTGMKSDYKTKSCDYTGCKTEAETC